MTIPIIIFALPAITLGINAFVLVRIGGDPVKVAVLNVAAYAVVVGTLLLIWEVTR